MSVKNVKKEKYSKGNRLRIQSIKAKLLSIIFIAMGVYLIVIGNDSLYQKIGFGAVFIGLFTFFLITEKTIPKIIDDAQMISNMKLIRSLTNSLNLEANGIYMPSEGKLSEERVFIAASVKDNYKIPELDDSTVFITGEKNKDGESPEKNVAEIHALLIPPGLELLDTFEREMGINVENIEINELEQYLQIMKHGLDIIKDLSIIFEDEQSVKIKIKHSAYWDICKDVSDNMGNLYKQTGCPICSSVLCAVTRTSGKKVRIYDVEIIEPEIIYSLKIGE